MNFVNSIIKDLLLVLSGSFFSGDKHAVPIITYHSIDGSGSSISRSLKRFKVEIALLKQWGFRTISFDELLTGELKHSAEDGHPMIITFDDGYENNLTQAIPVLEDHGFSATIFMTTGRAGGVNDWSNHPSVPELRMLSNSMIQEVERRGFTVLPHTVTHPNLSKLTEAQARYEIEASIDHLESLIGKERRIFCYPYGRYNDQTLKILNDLGVRAAVTTHFGKNMLKPQQPLLLDRIGSAYFSSAFSQKVTLTGRYDRYQKLKALLKG